MRSSVPAFKKALKERLHADPEITAPNLTVSWGNPHPAPPTLELVVVGNTANREIEYRGAMTQARETYDCEVLVSVIGPALASHEELLTRAYDIAEAIVTSILAWRLENYGGTVDVVTEGPSSDDESVDGEGRESSILLSFHVTARI